MNLVSDAVITKLQRQAFKMCDKNNDQQLLETYSDLLAAWAVKNSVEICLKLAINDTLGEEK